MEGSRFSSFYSIHVCKPQYGVRTCTRMGFVTFNQFQTYQRYLTTELIDLTGPNLSDLMSTRCTGTMNKCIKEEDDNRVNAWLPE